MYSAKNPAGGRGFGIGLGWGLLRGAMIENEFFAHVDSCARGNSSAVLRISSELLFSDAFTVTFPLRLVS